MTDVPATPSAATPARKAKLPAGMSLQLRLTLFFAGFMVLVLLFVGLLVYSLTRRSLIESLEVQTGQAIAGVLEAVDANPSLAQVSLNRWIQTLPSDALFYVNIYFGNPRSPAPLQVFSGFERLPRESSLKPSDGTGAVALLGEANFETLRQRGSLRATVTDENGVIWVVRARHAVTSQLLVFSTSADQVDVPMLLLVALPVRGETLAQLRTNLLQTILAALLVFPFGVWFLAHRALTPLKRMTRAAAHISSQDMSKRVPVPKSRDEVGALSVTLNKMLERLQESFETQRRFTADASHELRTPVTAIYGHANYLLRRTKPTEEQLEPLTIIRSEAERMSKLVGDLLELARADAGLTVRREPMNLVEVIEGLDRELAPVAGRSKIESYSPQPLLEVSGDATRLKQVVINLVQNALNAGSSKVSVSLAIEGAEARLEVLDDGPGIPESAIPKLFDRFYRVDGARSTRGNGSGLGLAIVRWIVEQHDGRVVVESKVGEGTVVTVLLPLLHPEEAARPRTSRPRAS